MSTGTSADNPLSGANPPAAENADKNPTTPAANGTPTPAESTATPKLTNAQLKAKAKAEKQARRAQAKQATETTAPAGAGAASGSATADTPAKGGKGKGKGEGAPASSLAASGRQAANKATPAPAVTDPDDEIPDIFAHLSIAKRISYTQADKDVHPTVLALGQRMATFEIDESMERLQATLLAFKEVIESYTTPPGNTLARHLTPHVLNPQIDYLSACRPMCFSMGNAIRWLKLRVSQLDPDVPETEAKKLLCTKIDAFIQERITLADMEIIRQAVDGIKDGQTILVFGRSTLVERTLLRAYCDEGKKIKVIVVDDPVAFKGQILAKNLIAKGITVTYTAGLGGLMWHVERADQILVAAEAMFSNGAIYAPAGTADVALAAKEKEKEVIVLCESINITERVAIDGLTYNEIDPDRCTYKNFRLLYDTTTPQYVTSAITEVLGVGPATVSHILRKLEESN